MRLQENLKNHLITFVYNRLLLCFLFPQLKGSHSDWKTWKNGKAFSSQGKVREF